MQQIKLVKKFFFFLGFLFILYKLNFIFVLQASLRILNLPSVRCAAHSMQLAINDAINKISKLIDLLAYKNLEIYKLFAIKS
jgi:hypothetical protein